MESFIEELGKRKANYYYYLYKSNKRAERKEECLERVRMLDEYNLLLDIIEFLPYVSKKQLDKEYEVALENIMMLNK